MPRATTRKKPSFNFITSIANRILKINIVYLLGFLLIVASFLIGVLITKVSYLEGGSGNTTSNNSAGLGDIQQPSGPVDVSQGHLPILGKSNAKVKIIEFSDFQCPFCKSLFDDSLAQIKKDYVDSGKASFAYRHYPLTTIHANAQKAAEASECANEQNKFWEYHDELFINQAEWESLESTQAQAKFVEYAGTLGLDTANFDECLTSAKFEDAVNKDTADGTKAGVSGTPATFINGIIVEGAVPYANFKAEIEKALAK